MHHIPPNLSASRRRSSRTRAPLAAKATKIASVQISFPHPLSWWRSRCADEFKDIDVNIARHILRRSAIIGEPHWFLGAAGDAAVAIGVALRTQRQFRHALLPLDVAMTAVLCVALEGDATAALQSQKGRAAWVQERSIGHADPGATAYLRFLEGLLAALG